MLRVCLVIVSLLLISGCTYHSPPPVPDNNRLTKTVTTGLVAGATVGAFASGAGVPIVAAMGGVAGGAIGLSLGKDDSVADQLGRYYVQVVEIGDDVMLVLPSHYYFAEDSSHLNEAFYPGLDFVANFLAQYETEAVKVAGYTDNTGSDKRNIALSRQQAQNIAHYLWQKGIDARTMYSTGYGEQFPIATNETPDGRGSNRRVQITFRRLTA